VRLKKYGTSDEVDTDLLRSVLDTLAQLTKFTSALEGHGGSFREILKLKKDGKLPEFMVRVRLGNEETVHYLHDEADLNAFAEENRDLRLNNEELTEEEIEQFKEKYEGAQRRAVKRDLNESMAISKILERLGEFGLDTDPFFSDDKPVYELIEGDGGDDGPVPVFNLFEILDRVLEIGRKGMRIQRFKGLGEMNAKELFSTTMDPERCLTIK